MNEAFRLVQMLPLSLKKLDFDHPGNESDMQFDFTTDAIVVTMRNDMTGLSDSFRVERSEIEDGLTDSVVVERSLWMARKVSGAPAAPEFGKE